MRHSLHFLPDIKIFEVKPTLLFFAALFSFLQAAQSQIHVSHRAVPLTTEKSLSVQLDLGTLKLQLGSQQNSNAFEYEFHSTDTASLLAAYSIRDGVGYLSLQHNQVKDETRRRRIRLDWRSLFGGSDENEEEKDLRESVLKLFLPTGIPVQLDFSVGAGYNDLNMSGLKISDLNLVSGACATKLRFNEPNPVTMKKLRLSTGASKLVVEGLGNANFEEMDFSGGASNVVLDFSGSEFRSSKVNVSIGAGSLRILLPKEAGVKIKYADNFFSSIALPDDFTQDGEWFYSGNFSKAKHVLELHVSSGVGSVRVRWK
ncbi:MAG: hypothetical protein ACK41G_08060 [Candidatus Thermochlorobacter sp.]